MENKPYWSENVRRMSEQRDKMICCAPKMHRWAGKKKGKRFENEIVSEFVRINNQPSSFKWERKIKHKIYTSPILVLPGLKCHSWSSEDDTGTTRTVSTVTENSLRVGKAMTAATHLVTCPETHWWPQAYLSQKQRYLDLRTLEDYRLCLLKTALTHKWFDFHAHVQKRTHTALAWGCCAHRFTISIDNSALSIKSS